MNSIASIVELLIKRQPFLAKMLIDELINLSSLARNLKPNIDKKLKKEVQLGSIVMALKRLTPILQGQIMVQTNKFLKNYVDVNVRSNLCIHTFENSRTMVLGNLELLEKLSVKKNVFHTVSCGIYETSIVISSQYCNLLEEVFEKEVLLQSSNNLSSITISTEKEYADFPGLYHMIFSTLAWQGISVTEIISTPHEISLIIKELDTGKTYNCIKELFINSKEKT